MADLVLNHCSAQSEWFTNFKRGKGPGSDYSSSLMTILIMQRWFGRVRARWCSRLRWKMVLFVRYGAFSKDQVDLNYAEPKVLLEICRILKWYADHQIRFFRLDAVAFLWKASGTSCVHLNETHEVVKLIRLLLEHILLKR